MLGGAYIGPGLSGGIKGDTWENITEKYNLPLYSPKTRIDTGFSKDFGFVVFFVFMALMITVFTKEKVLFSFLVVVLLGMVLVNADKITSLLKFR